jgi:hypothetical protein
MRKFTKKVIKSITDQSISFISLVISLSFISYDKFVANTEIPVGAVLSATGTSSTATISLFTVGVVLFLGTLAYGVVQAVRS